MKKIIFKNRIVYLLSVVFFSLSSLVLITNLAIQIGENFSLFSFLYLSVLAILSIIVCIKLFEKEKNAITYINVLLPILIISVIFNSLKIYSTHYIYEPEDIIFAILMIIFLVIINKNKLVSSEIAKEDEIDEIGKS
ncbi:hypothetical protein K0U91_11615 [Chryseobacterium chendengshani]|uniref:hypothetical protein n=1 Tax=Chryseobacterium sp. LJ668 TaxID=2864040 RepID=UPI001C691BBD|nr:hypothetical protein [Chryseobacterium sp. LJ668]MBW8523418.1 hypothetical protein [Chryseobacterium sp. LJ668]QYK15706.1 hypothetical protein K0U91_11615 [Chryseobacterium sp. LJ668]